MASGKEDGPTPAGENISEFDVVRSPNSKPTKPTREDIRELLETKIFIFNFSFNPFGSNKAESTVDKRNIPYTDIANDLYDKYRLYKVQSDEGERYSLTPQTYVAYIKGTREEGIATAKKIIDAVKNMMKEDYYKDKVDQVHIIASLAIVYDDQHRVNKKITVSN